MSTSPTVNREGLFRTAAGQNYTVTFFLMTTLFLLWGFCNGMIDVMDKHFQDQLHLTKAQSAWVQFAHYMGYAIMALPAGMLSRKIGYKGGIITGLLLVALGGFWFIPATHIAQFWAFLMGVCLIAMGLTVLETVANPYTTLLGPKQFGSSRINLAQSFNGVGWIFGPIVGGMYFYSDGGSEVAQGQLYIPYMGIGFVVLLIAGLFFFANVPDIKTEDEYHTDDDSGGKAVIERNRALVFVMMLLNIAFVGLSLYLVLHTILPFCGVSGEVVGNSLSWIIIVAVLATIPALVAVGKRKVTTHSIWAHPHFSAATLCQFVYVAAQAGIFSFFINTMTVDKHTGFCLVPGIPSSWTEISSLKGWFVAGPDGIMHFSDKGAATLASIGFAFFLVGRLIGSALLKKSPAHKVLGVFAVLNIGACALVMANLGWLSVFCVFLSYFFMSIMFPTIFALGIYGLGAQAKKKASAFIVMSITGGALMPKLMGHLGDVYNMSVAFAMPLGCFVLIAAYAFFWPKLSQSDGLHGVASGSSR